MFSLLCTNMGVLLHFLMHWQTDIYVVQGSHEQWVSAYVVQGSHEQWVSAQQDMLTKLTWCPYRIVGVV